MTKKLTEQDVIQMMREEWQSKVDNLRETINLMFKTGDDKETVLSDELKIVHTKSGIRYTVSSVGPRDVVLRTPEGEEFIVDGETIEKEYHLD